MTKVRKPIGARNLTFFPLVDDTDTELAAAQYQTAIRLSRLIQVTLTPILSEASLESDDGIEEDESNLIGYTVKIDASQLTDSIRSTLLGHSMDDGDGLLFNGNDSAPMGALAFKQKLSGTGTSLYKHVVLYKGRFKEFEESGRTEERNNKTYQTHSLEGTFYKRDYDGNIRYDMREDSPNANATKIAAWFTTPQEAGDDLGSTVETPVADPVAGAVAAGTNIELTCSTSGAEIRYTLDGSTPGASSTLYDGPITINDALTIKAAGFKTGMNPSAVLTAAYTLL